MLTILSIVIVPLLLVANLVVGILIYRRRMPPQVQGGGGPLADALLQGSLTELHRISKKNAGRLHIHDVETVLRARRRTLGD